MTYDFDALTDRSGTYSLKWEEAGDALPMWVADMDFQTAPPIREAMRRRLDHGVFGYSIVPDEWTDAYIGWWRDRHGVTFERESLIFCTGTSSSTRSSTMAATCLRRRWRTTRRPDGTPSTGRIWSASWPTRRPH